MFLHWVFPSSLSMNSMYSWYDKDAWWMGITSEKCSFYWVSFSDAILTEASWDVFLKLVEDVVEFFLCFCNCTQRYHFYKLSTMLLALEELYIVNWFQFWMFNKITCLFSIFNIELVSLIWKWFLFMFLFFGFTHSSL